MLVCSKPYDPATTIDMAGRGRGMTLPAGMTQGVTPEVSAATANPADTVKPFQVRSNPWMQQLLRFPSLEHLLIDGYFEGFFASKSGAKWSPSCSSQILAHDHGSSECCKSRYDGICPQTYHVFTFCDWIQVMTQTTGQHIQLQIIRSTISTE